MSTVTQRGAANFQTEVKRKYGCLSLRNQTDHMFVSKKWMRLVTISHHMWKSLINSDHPPVSVRLKLHVQCKKIGQQVRQYVQQLQNRSRILTYYHSAFISLMNQLKKWSDAKLNIFTFTEAIRFTIKESDQKKPCVKKKPLPNLEAASLTEKRQSLKERKFRRSQRRPWVEERAKRNFEDEDNRYEWTYGNYKQNEAYFVKASLNWDDREHLRLLDVRIWEKTLVHEVCLMRGRDRFKILLNRQQLTLPLLQIKKGK